jgi:hypothetical protein
MKLGNGPLKRLRQDWKKTSNNFSSRKPHGRLRLRMATAMRLYFSFAT